jgi:hypothetical protein
MRASDADALLDYAKFCADLTPKSKMSRKSAYFRRGALILVDCFRSR